MHVFSKRFSFNNCACKMRWRWILNYGFGVTLQTTAQQVKEESEGFASILIVLYFGAHGHRMKDDTHKTRDRNTQGLW